MKKMQTSLFLDAKCELRSSILNLTKLCSSQKFDIIYGVIQDLFLLHSHFGLCFGKGLIELSDVSIEFENKNIAAHLCNRKFLCSSTVEDSIEDDIISLMYFVIHVVTGAPPKQTSRLGEEIFQKNVNRCNQLGSEFIPTLRGIAMSIHQKSLSGLVQETANVNYHKKNLCFHHINAEPIDPILNSEAPTTNDLIEIIEYSSRYRLNIVVAEKCCRLYLLCCQRRLFDSKRISMFVSIYTIVQLFKIDIEFKISTKHTTALERAKKSCVLLELLPLVTGSSSIHLFEIFCFVRNPESCLLDNISTQHRSKEIQSAMEKDCNGTKQNFKKYFSNYPTIVGYLMSWL